MNLIVVPCAYWFQRWRFSLVVCLRQFVVSACWWHLDWSLDRSCQAKHRMWLVVLVISANRCNKNTLDWCLKRSSIKLYDRGGALTGWCGVNCVLENVTAIQDMSEPISTIYSNVTDLLTAEFESMIICLYRTNNIKRSQRFHIRFTSRYFISRNWL